MWRGFYHFLFILEYGFIMQVQVTACTYQLSGSSKLVSQLLFSYPSGFKREVGVPLKLYLSAVIFCLHSHLFIMTPTAHLPFHLSSRRRPLNVVIVKSLSLFPLVSFTSCLFHSACVLRIAALSHAL